MLAMYTMALIQCQAEIIVTHSVRKGQPCIHLEGHWHPQQLSRYSGWPEEGPVLLSEAGQAVGPMSCPQRPLSGRPASAKDCLMVSPLSQNGSRKPPRMNGTWVQHGVLCLMFYRSSSYLSFSEFMLRARAAPIFAPCKPHLAAKIKTPY